MSQNIHVGFKIAWYLSSVTYLNIKVIDHPVSMTKIYRIYTYMRMYEVTCTYTRYIYVYVPYLFGYKPKTTDTGYIVM